MPDFVLRVNEEIKEPERNAVSRGDISHDALQMGKKIFRNINWDI